MRERIHRLFCLVGIHRWTEWEEIPKGRAPLSPDASELTKIMYWGDFRYSRFRCCVFCDSKQNKPYPVDPSLYR